MATQYTRADILKTINEAASNPSSILQATLDTIEEINEGSVEFVDASNPAVSNYETSAILHTSSVQQHVAALRGLYPSLAQTPDHLYNHMSYRDYINRFASPSTDPFIFFVSFSQFMQRAVRVPGTNYSKITYPRDTRITVNDYVSFTLQYPVDIKYFDTESLEVAFDAEIASPLQSLSTNIIHSELIIDPNSQEKWIRFEIPVPQIKINKVTDNVQAGRYFITNIGFTDQYFMARAYYRNSSSDSWKEMQTTHSPSVYDPRTPTLQLKVIGQTLNASLPLIYQNSGLVSGELRIDIYTTKGSETINLEDYPISEYVLDMQPLDPNRDTTLYTAAAMNVSTSCRSTAIMSGGKDSLTFEELRDRVMNNSTGPQESPVTDINIKSAAQNMGFELVTNIDVVTNRIFLATRKLPKPSDPKLVTSANIGISIYNTDDPTTINHEWVKVHGKRTTFLPKNLYKSDRGILTIQPSSVVRAIQLMEPLSKLSAVNSNKYLYSPFYYVLDTSSLELQIRAYHLDQPEARDISFLSQNSTLQLVVNTAGYLLSKTDNGYKLQITTRSGNFYKQLADNEVMVQLGVKLVNSERYAYWNGTQVGKTAEDERIFEFNIETGYDITAADMLVLTNGQIDQSSNTPIEVNLNGVMDIFHITTSLTSLYRPSDIDENIGRFMLPSPCAAITKESIRIGFGVALHGLWTRGRTIPDSEVYEYYSSDVEMVYDNDVYAEPPFTIDNGVVTYHTLFRRGDVVRDSHGDIMYEHRKGDIVKIDGEPVVSGRQVGSREFDLLMIDGRHYFVNDTAYTNYNNEFISILVDWITTDIATIQKKALEKTKVFFYPKNQLTTASLLVADFTQERIQSEQSLVVDLYVTDEIHRNLDLRSQLQRKTIAYLATWISDKTVAISSAVNGLKDLYGDSVVALKLYGLGGDKDFQLANIIQDEDRMCLKRILDVQQDGTYIIREDVTINFYKASPISPT